MTDYIIEGVSHEVFFVLIITILSVFIIYLLTAGYLSQRQPGSQVIHPSERANVDSLRRELTHRDDRDHSNIQDNCPICIEQIRLITETNCGHLFCAPCVVAYWNHGSWLHEMNCPVCRQKVTVLLVNFSENENATEEANQALTQIRAYNRRFSGEPRTIREYITDFPVLLRHMVRQLFSVNGMVWMFRLRVILYLSFVVLYFISPLDLIPESVTGIFGFVDDLLFLLLVLVYLTVLFRSFLSRR